MVADDVQVVGLDGCAYAGNHGMELRHVGGEAEMAEDPELLADLHSALTQVNARVAPDEQIKDCRVVLRSATDGGLTASTQRPRNTIMRELHDTIAALPE